MNIDGVSTGIVLDHIDAGKSMLIYKLLHLDRLDCAVAIIQNAKSDKYGKKDIIKIDQIIDLNFDMLGYVDPHITVNIVKDGKLYAIPVSISSSVLYEKKHMALPKRLQNVISCSNPRCITSVEKGVDQRFYLANEEHRIYRCEYCDTAYKEHRK